MQVENLLREQHRNLCNPPGLAMLANRSETNCLQVLYAKVCKLELGRFGFGRGVSFAYSNVGAKRAIYESSNPPPYGKISRPSRDCKSQKAIGGRTHRTSMFATRFSQSSDLLIVSDPNVIQYPSVRQHLTIFAAAQQSSHPNCTVVACSTKHTL